LPDGSRLNGASKRVRGAGDIDALYMLFLGRVAESEQARADNYGKPVLDVAEAMIGSEEFRDEVLNRFLDEGALPHDRLPAEVLRKVAAFAAEHDFATATPEKCALEAYTRRLEPFAGGAFVVAAYRIILGREPDPEGRAHSLARLEATDASKRQIIAEMLGSDEFRQRGTILPFGWRSALHQVFAFGPGRRLLDRQYGSAGRKFVAALEPAHADLMLHISVILGAGRRRETEAVLVRDRLWIRGWALAREGVASIEIAAGEQHLGTACNGLPSEAVAEMFPDWPDAGRSGFAAVIPVSDLPEEVRVVRVVLRDNTGRTAAAEFFVETVEGREDEPMRPALSETEIEFYRELLDDCEWQPCFCLVMPIAAEDEEAIEAARASLAALGAQPYEDWRLLAVARGRAESLGALHGRLAEGLPAIADRVAIIPAHGSTPLVRIARRMAAGRPALLIPLAPGTELGADALFEFAAVSVINPNAEVITGKAECGPGLSCMMMPLLDRADASLDDLLTRGISGLSTHCLEKAYEARHLPFIFSRFDEQFSAPSPGGNTSSSALRRLAGFLREEFCDSAARRTLGYFEIIEALGLSHPPGTASRREIIALLVGRMQRLSRAANDGRPIAASIVIPVFNRLEYTIASVMSLLEHGCSRCYEILIGNDASTDETQATFEAVGGIVRCITHENNQGFLGNCNASGKYAVGNYIVLLNNDTLVLDNWLDELLDTLAGDESIGLVGSKLINSDGSLQEAGGIFWKDGSAWNYGRNADPGLPEFNYVKEVDYCSGAAIALPKAVWEALGGFDPLYAPAYCEEADLAFRVRAAGRKVVYQPFAAVIHHEGVTHGRDTASGVKAYQIVNQQKFFERWSYVLAKQNFPNGEAVFLARDRTRERPHILVVDHYVPQWDRDAGSRSIYQYLQLFLARGFRITLWPDNLHRDPSYTKPLQKLGIEVIYSHRYAGRFSDWIKENGKYFKYLFLSRPHVATKYIDAVKRHAWGPVLFYGHDLHWLRLEKEFALTGDTAVQAELEETRILEEQVWNQVDVVLYLISEETEIVRQRFPGKKAATVPGFIYDFEAIAEARRRAGNDAERDPFHLLFVGGFAHRPNGDGILWFMREVFDRLRARDRRFRLTIVGSNPPPEITALACADITVAGQVSDAALAGLYRTAGAAIVPLRYGGGIKGKVIEAFANAIPLVSTSVGLQGIARGEELAFVGDDPEAFADRVFEACTDRDLAAVKVGNAIAFLERRYSRAAARRALSEYVEEFQDAPDVDEEEPLLRDIRREFASREDWLGYFRGPECVQEAAVAEALSRIRRRGFSFQLLNERAKPEDIAFPAEASGLRESLIYKGINSRQRAVLDELLNHIKGRPVHSVKIFAPESISPFAMLLRGIYPFFYGSEYSLDPVIRKRLYPVPIEDLAALSMPDATFDAVLANDVFEHLPDLSKALSEIARVLKKDGVLISTFPFNCFDEEPVVRAQMRHGRIEHLMEPEYHGDPVDEKGALVFSIPGWGILRQTKAAGFSTARMVYYLSERCGVLAGHFGGVMMLVAVK
jgi:GT2 family glycosyltransferase